MGALSYQANEKYDEKKNKNCHFSVHSPRAFRGMHSTQDSTPQPVSTVALKLILLYDLCLH